MLRGDDVAELQRRLNALGFDAGREDGILGPETEARAVEFQRNAGLAPDGICGPATLAALDHVGSLAEGSVASVREPRGAPPWSAPHRGPPRVRRRAADAVGGEIHVALPNSDQGAAALHVVAEGCRPSLSGVESEPG